ncbi:MAG: putative acyltransferase [Ilumatobacteraceae bacterium]|nr:putative acyltransferase [Ilumatobacteraceae bacterium]
MTTPASQNQAMRLAAAAARRRSTGPVSLHGFGQRPAGSPGRRSRVGTGGIAWQHVSVIEPTPPPATAAPPKKRRRSLRERVVGGEIQRTVLSLWWWLTFGLGVALWVPMVAVVRLVTAPFDKGHYWAGYLFRKLPVVHQFINPLWTFRVSGTMPDDPRRPYIIVSNHESFVDILLISHLPFEMKWLSKVEMFKIPAVGWLMAMADDIRLSRGEISSATDAMNQCKDRLAKRVSVLIFAEGTRSTTGELGKFKNGAFRLAIETGCPILPIAVSGCHTALRPKDWRLGYSTAEVRVLEPIEVEGLTMRDTYMLRDKTRAAIAAEIEVLRAELAERALG